MLTEQDKQRTALYRKARRQVLIAKFERNCRCVQFEGRRRKAYAVPGTQEAGRHAMLRRRIWDLVEEYKAAK